MPRWRDFDISLEKKSDGDIKNNDDIEAIRNSVHNIFLTRQGTRRMMHPFSRNVHSLLFEPIDESTAARIGELLIDALEKWEDRIVLNNLHIEGQPDKHLYKVFLNVSLRNAIDSEIILTEIITVR